MAALLYSEPRRCLYFAFELPDGRRAIVGGCRRRQDFCQALNTCTAISRGKCDPNARPLAGRKANGRNLRKRKVAQSGDLL